jgi:hypothetical protein
MHLTRLAAFIAVTLIAFACDSKNVPAKILLAEIPTDQKEMGVAQLIDEEEAKTRHEEFYKDTTGRQVNTAKLKQRSPGEQPAIKNDWDKKIIKTASLNIEVKDYSAFYASLREKVRSTGGYIAQEQQSESDYKIENIVTIKVPVDQFDNAVMQLTSNIERLNDKKISSQDVTTEVIDTKSRIEAKKQVRLRYMDLLRQAKNMGEILSVQSEINEIQEEIESAAGRLEYLGHSSTFSTIQLTFFQVLNSSAKNASSPSFGTKLSNAFNTGWRWIGDLFIGLAAIWPLFLLLFTSIIIYKRLKWRKPRQA